MTETDSVLDWFSTEEKQKLEKLERQRVVLRRKPVLWIFFSVIFISIIGTMIIVHELTKYQDAAWPVIVMMFVCLCYFGSIAWLTFKFPERDTISWKYKRMMLRKLVPKILPGWVSSSSHRLMNEDIRKSGLFRDKAKRIAREDYLFGPAGKVVAEVYQIALEVEGNNKPEKGLGILEGTNNHFYGFFYRVHCPVIFPCDVWIFPRQRKIEGEVDDWAELSKGKFANSAARNKFNTGDVVFDEHFSVYTNDPSKVMIILSDHRRNSLVEVDRLFSTACAFSYTENKVYAMIGFTDDPLDINMKKEIGTTLLQCHADELARMKDVAMLVSSM
ncbi:hypothetical protein BH09BAC5_BH09BAC5_28500 [soil metagenome]